MSAGGAGTGREDVTHPERARNLDEDATLGLDPWRPLHDACICVCIQQPKTDAELQRLAELWSGRRHVELRLLGYATESLEFLRHFPGLQRLHIESPIIRSIEGLRHVAGTLKEFALTNTTVRL